MSANASKFGDFLAWVFTPVAWVLLKLGFGPPPAEFEPPDNSNDNDKQRPPKDY